MKLFTRIFLSLGLLVFVGGTVNAQGVTRVCVGSVNPVTGQNNCVETNWTISNGGTSAANHAAVVKTGPSYFYSAICSMDTSSTGGYCMVFDAASAPTDGAVTPCGITASASCLRYCAAIPPAIPATNVVGAPSVGIASGSGTIPAKMANGVVVVVSTGANCATKTTSDGFSVFETGTAE